MPEKFLYARCEDHNEPVVFSGILKWNKDEVNFIASSPLIVDDLLPHHLKYKSHDHRRFDLFCLSEDANLLEEPEDYRNKSVGFVIITSACQPIGNIEIESDE